ncbi:uncharacterized protein K489DRAFT_224166 [Dissoconium aciculare CBS 342.82]|uniref:Uncharacterized protein n=1 Tax=Dissoconium aciculare CBS 342.82 TaxID=1314786 RepID=A0A6J3M4V9_9PEZI|nr:uncharacterized protein K489DRAFT_224166 [Dissoconium aciculare CBS 342.82]KAF1823066.1 hypothetical protein K489DRAFT_224166 [Dissoconium aciculare CBS 342.82]
MAHGSPFVTVTSPLGLGRHDRVRIGEFSPNPSCCVRSDSDPRKVTFGTVHNTVRIQSCSVVSATEGPWSDHTQWERDHDESLVLQRAIFFRCRSREGRVGTTLRCAAMHVAIVPRLSPREGSHSSVDAAAVGTVEIAMHNSPRNRRTKAREVGIAYLGRARRDVGACTHMNDHLQGWA